MSPTLNTTLTLNIPIDGLSAAQVEELQGGVDDLLRTIAQPENAVLGWTETAVRQLHARLLAENRPVQAEVLRTAAANGGACDRDTVYSIGGYAPSRSLKGFTRPVHRILDALEAEGILPTDAADPMKPIYSADVTSFQRAQGFRMAPELAAHFASVLG